MATDNTKLIIELEVLLKNLNKTLSGLDQIKRKLESVANIRLNQRSTTAATDRQVLSAQRLALAQQRLQIQQQRLGVQTQELANRQERARQSSEKLARSAVTLGQTLNRQSNIVKGIQQRLGSLSAAALRVGGGLRSLGLTASVALTGPLVALATVATKNAVEFDSLQRGLTVMAGSSQEAARQLERLKEIAKAPGIGFQEAIQGSIRLQAVGFSARDAEKALIGFANAVALTGGGREELERITVQLGQLAAKGKVVAQDLKPIIEAGPAVGQALLQAFGTVNAQDIQKLGLSTEEFFKRLTDALDKLPRAAAGAKNAFENFSDSMFRASLALGNAILPPLTKLVDLLEPIIQKLAAAFASLPESIQVVIIVLGALAAAAGPLLFVLGGLVSGIGAVGTAIAALIPILSSVGLPAIAAILAGLVILTTELTAVITTLGIAWRTNFLNIRQLVTNAANAIVGAFIRFRRVFDETIQRVLPTLQSITAKTVGGVQKVWEKYGETVIHIVSTSFLSIVRVTVSFLRLFGNIIDLILKLVDNDWRGAWRAFARIVVAAMDSVIPIIGTLVNTFQRSLNTLVAFLIRKAVEIANAGTRLAILFIETLNGSLIASSPKVRDALTLMLIAAMSGIAFGPIAQAFVARFIAELRKAAAEGGGPFDFGPKVSVDPGFEPPARKARGFGPPSADGGGSGKGARALQRQAEKLREAQDKLDEQRNKDRLALLESSLNQQFDLTKDSLAREAKALDDSFDDRLTVVKKFFQERLRIQQAEIDAEIRKELGLTEVVAGELAARKKIIEQEFQTDLKNIAADTRLKGRAKILATQTAELDKQRKLGEATTEAKQKAAEIDANLLKLDQDRKDAATDLGRAEVELTRELTKQRDQVRFDLLEEQGRTSDAAAGRLKQTFRDTIRDLRIDLTQLSADLQKSINDVDISTLQEKLDQLPEPVQNLVELLDIGIKRAQILEAQKLVEDLSAGLRLDEERIQAKVLDGLLSQRDAQAAILALQRQYREVLLDVLKGELAKAEAIKDQGQITAIQAQIEETKRLGVEIDSVGQQINQAFVSDIQSGISGIFSGARKGFEGLRDAAISFGERLLDTLNDIAATSIVNKLQDIFKPDATNTQGTVGGFFSKLFGLAPKRQADAAAASTTLQAGATSASATLQAGAATSSATFSTSVVTAATSFASLIISAGAAFAAAVGAASAAQAVGGLGSAFSGAAAATGLFPAVPGGVVRVVEGGFPEAVLTTDPKHAQRQVAILRAFLRETKGLGGRIRGLAMGGFTLPDLAPSVASPSVGAMNFSNLDIGGDQRAMNLRILNLLDKRSLVGGHLRSAEGTQDILNLISENSDEIGRRIGIR